jgi:hypothetical protein
MSWDEMCSILETGYPVKYRHRDTPCDVAIFPAPSGLVILDCDVKRYQRDTGHVANRNHVTFGDLIEERHGVDDLRREVERLGHSMDELYTYTVKTKSGGRHLYFRENPEVSLTTNGHRENWRVDVIAHNVGYDRSWAAAPPTPGYEVTRDIPVAPLPTWLALFLRDDVPTMEPMGGRRARQRAQARLEARDQVMIPGLSAGERDSLIATYVGWVLTDVIEANKHGGWNLAIYGAVKDLMRVGYAFDQVAEVVMEHADPVNDAERRKAEYTINSAERSYARETRGSRGGK